MGLLKAESVAFVLLLLSVCIASAAGNFSCSITASGSCSYTKVLYMKNDTAGYWNAHAENVSAASYPYAICCDSNATLALKCGEGVLFNLNTTTNTHVQRGDYAGPGIVYGIDACIATTPGYFNCTYVDDACPANRECFASMTSDAASENNDTNAHVGPCDEYRRKVCCRAVNDIKIMYVSPTPEDSARTINNSVTINVTVDVDSALTADTCILEWSAGAAAAQNETMEMIGSGSSVTCNATKATADATVYTFRVYANDSANAFGSGAARQFRENDEPSKVTLSSPADGSHTTDRTPTFQWDAASDGDFDTLTYYINISCFGGDGCSEDNRFVNVGTGTSYTPSEELEFFGDDNFYYNWSVMAFDNYENGTWSDPWNLTIDVDVSITMINSMVDFGENRLLGYTDNTTDSDPSPFSLKNTGNCMIDVNISSSDLLWDAVSQPSDYFNYSVNWFTGEEGAFNWSGSQTSSVNMPVVAQNVSFINYLNYTFGNSSAEIELYIKVPPAEPPGTKSSLIIFTGEYHR